jgi:hypothetical protein
MSRGDYRGEARDRTSWGDEPLDRDKENPTARTLSRGTKKVNADGLARYEKQLAGALLHLYGG